MGERPSKRPATLYEVMTGMVRYYEDRSNPLLGGFIVSDFGVCWVCEEKALYNSDAWGHVRKLANSTDKRHAVIVICQKCWESCPYHGALSLAEEQGGELTICDTGKLTEVRG